MRRRRHRKFPSPYSPPDGVTAVCITCAHPSGVGSTKAGILSVSYLAGSRCFTHSRHLINVYSVKGALNPVERKLKATQTSRSKTCQEPRKGSISVTAGRDVEAPSPQVATLPTCYVSGLLISPNLFLHQQNREKNSTHLMRL